LEIHVPAIAPQMLTRFGDLIITNTLLTSFIAIFLLLILAFAATARMQLVPGRMQGGAEAIIEGLLGLAEQAGGPAARKFLPLVGTLFLYILVSNWMGVIPGVGSLQLITHEHEEIVPFRSANSDLSLTAAMALIVFVWVQVTGIRSNVKAYFLKFLWPPGLNVLELIAEVARPVSLALRLFGNILAGFILVEVFLQLAPPVIPALALLFELFVGVVQALIFAILTIAFLSLATSHGHSEGHAAAQEHETH
jgi:F-type H+-transporting ATPase subunit a